jgi:predicted N-acetyltransferase YhbS
MSIELGVAKVTVHLRKGEAADAAAVGDICYRAFKAVAEERNFPPDFPSADMAASLLGGLIRHAGFFHTVAEIDGRIVGSNFLDERNPISGVGPVTVDPALQNDGAGRALMQAVMRRSQERGFAGIRLVQAGYHNRSLALYLKLGFEAREQLACLQGPAVGKTIPGHGVRPAIKDDLPACNRLCFRVHGHDRAGELEDAVGQGDARVVERAGRLTGYATPVAFFGHAVGETNDDLKALIGAAESFPGPGFLVPTRNGELMRWCLGEGLRIGQTMTLMTIGLYNQPDGVWLASVLY